MLWIVGVIAVAKKELNLENNIINISDGSNKSLILIKKENKLKGYISNISSQTLAKRMQK